MHWHASICLVFFYPVDTLTNDEIRDRIVRIYAQFVSDVDPDRLSDFLKQENILGIGEYQEISARNPSSYSRCRALLDHLLRKANPRTFLIVRQALKHDEHYLLDRIDRMNKSDHLPPNNDYGNLSQGRMQCNYIQQYSAVVAYSERWINLCNELN